MLKFQGKVALITGSGTGIGQAIAKKFAEKRDLKHMEISAKNRINIDETFTELIKMLREKDIPWKKLWKKLESGEDLMTSTSSDGDKCILH